MSHLEIEVEKRETRGKNANRRTRVAGRVPAVVYGGGLDPLAIQVGRRQFEEHLRTAGSENAVFLLKLAGTGDSRHTMIREMQQDPVTGELIHVDFYRILLDRKDLPSEGAGETPIICIAPAIGNAIFHATGKRLRSMPMVPNGLKKA